ncbi:geranylgeranyl reductase family protein [Kineosphaera limosa]|uniref:Putative geranylgeranyl reductase n=1 Tax=Kineosphaera limosa NBRC 100340 TaxID=1184609 RepID=K6W4N5_9MICO|nr:geranylgeranyl reductase family protein [Kineosphaera limosa]NYE02265.1 geranylgeranyl reductase family protein [Kineosphaera limosa]GAB94120.1 putative geranylgeranyl reductase [Kineosphaera limosa NBRC 100340]
MTGSGTERADVVVVGAGPGGSATAAYLAGHGLDVVLLEKARFPRDKICGDGLTPRAVKELLHLGVDTTGWARNRGLHIQGGGHDLTLDWPSTDAFPDYGLVRRRSELDETLARYAAACGARLLEGMNVQAPLRDDRTGRIAGVQVKVMGPDGRATGERRSVLAPVVVAADGVSSRLATALGRPKREDRPMGVAVRAYWDSPRTRDDYISSWLELWVPEDPAADPNDPATKKILMPGYAWLFPTGDGGVNVGLGMLDTSPSFGTVDYKDVLRRWIATTPAEWTLTPQTMTAPIRGAALPMCFNREPLYADGLLLVGDAGGMVNPFNGEGIDYALQAGRVAAECIAAAKTLDPVGRERALQRYQSAMKDSLGGYYTLGRHFAGLIGHPQIMRYAVKYGLPRTALMRLLLKVMANLGEPSGGRLDDRVIAALTRVTPAA